MAPSSFVDGQNDQIVMNQGRRSLLDWAHRARAPPPLSAAPGAMYMTKKYIGVIDFINTNFLICFPSSS